MSCCDQMEPLGCEQGRLCPARMARHSCAALAVCQHPERECAGACDQIPGLSVWYAEDEPPESLTLVEWIVFGGVIGVSAGVSYGLRNFLWERFGSGIEQLFWSTATRWF